LSYGDADALEVRDVQLVPPPPRKK
jgi:hypothetical protein